MNGTFTPPAGVTSVRYLVVGGGAGGGGVPNGGNFGGGGGGGAGGYRAATGFAVTPSTLYNITVGGGGAAGVGNTSQGGAGGASVFSTITSAGGGGGASAGVNNDGVAGASGGGGRINGAGGAGTGGQGNAGGNGSTAGGSGGGGGAGGVGAAGAGTSSGPGGAGTVNDITGANVTYAAGGNGGSYGSPRAAGTSGTAGTGNGGSGAIGDNGGGAFTGGAGGSGIVIVRYANPVTTTIATGTDPAAATIAPGAAVTDVNLFTLQTSSGTEAITSVTVNLSTGNGVGRLAITTNAGTELGFTTTPVTGANTITVAAMTATTTLTTFKVRVTPLSHAAMPPPPGAVYAITAPVTAWAGPNTHVGSDTNPNALTIDNQSPAGATATSGARGVGNTTLNWTTSVSGDFAATGGSVIYRWTGASAGAEVPAEGSAPAVGATNGTATVACVVSSAASTALSRIDGTGATPGVCTTAALPVGPYTYRVFQKDSRGNFDTGVTIAPAAAPPVVQAGRVDLIDTSVTQQFTNVCFDQPFAATPVVFSLPTSDGSDPAALRIRNVTPTGFEISLVEPSAMDGRHIAQTVDFLAIEPGTFTLPGGATLVAGIVSTAANQSKFLPGSSWTTVPFASSYGSAPAVLAMIQTMRNETGTPPDTSSVPWLTTAIQNVTGTGFDLALERAESTAGSITQNEDIAYLAIDDGQSGALTSQLNFEAIRSADFIQGWDNGCYTTGFATTYGSTPLVIATQNTRDGGDGGWLRRCSISTGNVGLTVDEDTDNDAERAHTTERAGIVVLSGTFGMHVCTPVVPTPGGFNAFESSTAPGAITGVIQTKVSGATASVDIVALNPARTAVLPAFTGDVRVEILNSSDNSGVLDPATGCRGTWTTIQTLTPDPTFVTADNGRKTISFSVPNAYRDARVRITHPAGAPTVTGCSTDNFAIRPSGLAVAVTDADWSTAGTTRALANVSATGGNVHKAGQPFTLTITPSPGTTTNYDGTPAVTALTCTLPAVCATGTFSAGAFGGSGTRVSNTATYSEAGAFNLTLADQGYASVDSADGTPADCSATGRYVCQSGAPLAVGRFVPDRFQFASPNTPLLMSFGTTSCASRSFTYIGQPFWYNAVMLPSATLNAVSAGGGITTNYAVDITASRPVINQGYTDATAPVTAPLDTTGIGLPTLSAGAGTGTYTAGAGGQLSYTRSAASPVNAFNAAISLTVTASDSTEAAVSGNGTITTPAPLVFNGGGGGGGIAFDGSDFNSGAGLTGGRTLAYGRLRLGNASGSQLLPLRIPVEAQYWNGTFFVTNTADSCTPLVAGNIGLDNYLGNLNAGETTVSAVTNPLSSGRGSITLSAPGFGNNGSVDVAVNLGAAATADACPAFTPAATPGNKEYLRGNWCSPPGTYSKDPSARARFGIRASDELIYMRETY